MNRNYKLYLDLDECLCDFTKSYSKLSGGLNISQYSKKFGDKKARQLFLDAGLDYWVNLDWVKGGKELYAAAKKNYSDIRILSSTGTSDEGYSMIVEQGKKMWLKKHIPEIIYEKIYIVRGRRWKKCYASNISILVDDMEDTIKEWRDEGGIGILHNSNYHEVTIDQLIRISKT